MNKYLNIVLSLLISINFSSCKEKEDDVVTKEDTYEINTDISIVKLLHNQEAIITIEDESASYIVKSYNEEIASATISGKQVTIKSHAVNGATTVEILNSNGGKKDVTVCVGLFDLLVDYNEIEIIKGREMSISVSLGNFSSLNELSYEIVDESIVEMSCSDDVRPFFNIKALRPGETEIIFKDKYEKIATVNVIVKPISIELSASSAIVGVNNKSLISVIDGNGNYDYTVDDESIVSVSKLSENIFCLIGKKAGETIIKVSDAGNQNAEIAINVVKADKVANIGSNNYFRVPFSDNNENIDNSLKSLNNITYEVRFMIDNLNGSDNAYINTLLGIEKICLLRVDVHKDASDKNARYIQLAADDKGKIRFEGKTQIQTNKWYTAAVVIDNSKVGNDRIALYIDGVKEDLLLSQGTTSDLKEINITSNFIIGQSDNKRALNGSISYARVWSKALSEAEIAENNNIFVVENQPELIANWQFNNGGGNRRSFISLTNNNYEAIGAYNVTTWTNDPLLSFSN